VLTLLLYLAEKYDGVTITSLVSGHGYNHDHIHIGF